MTFIQGEQGTKVEFRVEQGTKAILGTWNISKQFSILWEQGNNPIYFREQGNGYPPRRVPFPSHKRSNFQTIICRGRPLNSFAVH